MSESLFQSRVEVSESLFQSCVGVSEAPFQACVGVSEIRNCYIERCGNLNWYKMTCRNLDFHRGCADKKWNDPISPRSQCTCTHTGKFVSYTPKFYATILADNLLRQPHVSVNRLFCSLCQWD